MDFVWPKMAAEISGEPCGRSAIIDSISVRHTRPVGGNLHQMMQKVGGHTVLDEMSVALEGMEGNRAASINGIATPRIRILAGVDRSGKHRHGLNLVSRVAADLLAPNANKVQPIGRMAAIRHALKAFS
jgi:hypothetical protein